MIGGLQGEFGDLNIKYLKQKISKCWSQISESFRRTPWHCAKWLRNFRSKRTTFSQQKGDFAAVQNSSFSLQWSTSNGFNSFISALNHAPFEALDCWLHELRNDIYYDKLRSRKYSKSLQQWLFSWILHVRFLSLLSLLAFMICLW